MEDNDPDSESKTVSPPKFDLAQVASQLSATSQDDARPETSMGRRLNNEENPSSLGSNLASQNVASARSDRSEANVRIEAASTNTLARKRLRSAYKTVQRNTLTFLGLSDDWAETHQDKWTRQRLLLAKRQCEDPEADCRLTKQNEEAKEHRKNMQRMWRRQLSEDPQMLQRRAVAAFMQPDTRSEDTNDGSNRVVSEGVLERLDSTDAPQEEQEEESSDEDSDDELQKLSVATIAWKSVNKAATKWKATTKKVSSTGDIPLQQSDNVDAILPPAEKKKKVRHVKQKKQGCFSWMGGLKERVPDNYNESRPYFTFWVTSVHIMVLILSMVLYPWAPFGYGLKHITASVFTTSLSFEVIEYEEPASLWIGPSQSALVALGAKFTPCMRVEEEVQLGINVQREIEAETGCCIRHDQSGCVQTTNERCSPNLSIWSKWNEDEQGPENRTSGPVCGQDPRTCTAPASVPPNVWVDDITEWPICLSANDSLSANKEMPHSRDKGESYSCEVIGRPCCVGIHGECHITTREHCDLLNGYFHEEAALCSQVQCLSDVCKMLKFLNPEVPDQIYRLWVALFIHAGMFPFVLTIFFHLWWLRLLEKFAGTIRVTIIYILSGIAGNLASAIFVPSRPEVGPAGSIAGITACLFVIFIADFLDDMRTNVRVMLNWLVFLIIMFVIGLLPGVDNYANIFGFVMGVFLSIALLPHIGQSSQNVNGRDPAEQQRFIASGGFDSFKQSCPPSATSRSFPPMDDVFESKDGAACPDTKPKHCKRRLFAVVTSMSCALLLLVILFLVFYLFPFHCEWCGYLDCVPFTADFCAEQQTSFERHKIIT